MKPPFAYYGGKARLADWIVSLLPPHRVYVEPFAGSGAVLFAKTAVDHEIINDRDGDIVAFFRCLRDQPAELHRACRLTPYARDEFAAAAQHTDDDLEQARRFWVRVNQSFNKTGRRNNGFASSIAAGTSAARSTANRCARLLAAAERLSTVTIENRDAVDVIAAYDTADGVIYVDPPYLGDVRNGPNYTADATDEQSHRRIAEALHTCKAAVYVSGYPSGLYDEIYMGWHRVSRRHLRRSSNWNGGQLAHVIEVLWSNRPLDEGRLFDPGAIVGRGCS